jgi:hypothetical protein
MFCLPRLLFCSAYIYQPIFSGSVYTALGKELYDELGRPRFWSYYLNICLEGLRKPTTSLVRMAYTLSEIRTGFLLSAKQER